MVESLESWRKAAETVAAHAAAAAAAAGAAAWPVGALAGVAGVALLFAGIRLGPFLSGAAGGALTWLAFGRLPQVAAVWGVGAALQPWIAAAAVGVACALIPILYPLLLGAVPGALLGANVPILGRAWLGAAAGALLLGALCVAFRRLVLAMTAAVPGALLVDGALIALTPRLPWLATVTARPTLLLALGAVLAVAGTATQFALQRAPVKTRGRTTARGLDDGPRR